ncbi:MAG: MarC family protein [Bacteroidales bacterium]|nr:MarC family protein [Bacteroidales bacterium]
MDLSIKEIINVTLILFSVIDITGSIPIIIDLKLKAGNIQVNKATIVSFLIMIVFLFAGKQFLNLIGLDIHSFAIAGSIVIFFLAMEMILGITIYKDVASETSSIVPLAFPLIAGAGALTTLLSIRAEYQVINIIIGIFINCVIVYFVLRNTDRLIKLLGKNGINLLRKIFGIILLAIAIKLFKSNVGF